jgi:hypothetical protein
MAPGDEHDALRVLVASARPERITPEEVDRLLRHADACPACAAEMRELAALAILAQAPERRMEDHRAERVLGRVLGAAPAAPLAGRVRRSRASWVREGSGWLTAAALAVALITHHGFHEPLRSGWLAAGVFASAALGLGLYARAQRLRAARLERALRAGEREPGPPH